MDDLSQYIYKYETHCHDKICSACGHNLPEEIIDAYAEKGYSGLVFTNHFLSGNSCVNRNLSWEEKMKQYYDAYLRGKEYAAENIPDFHVLFGVEHKYEGGKELLTYGIDLEFLLAHPDLDRYPVKDYVNCVRQAGGLISMAHPYRHAPYIDDTVQPMPELLDGAEVYNAFNTDEENKQAWELAEKHGLIPTSGGDVHEKHEDAIGTAGIALKRPIDSSKELVEILKSREYRLIIKGEIL